MMLWILIVTFGANTIAADPQLNHLNHTFLEECVVSMCSSTSEHILHNITPSSKRRSLLIKQYTEDQRWNYFLHKHGDHHGYEAHKAIAAAHAPDGPVADYNPSILESDSPSLLKVFEGVIKVKWPGMHHYTYFTFKDYTKAFDDGILSLKQKREIIRLREQTVFRLIEYSVQKTDDPTFVFEPMSDFWYEKIGSDSLSSDFDLTYARWDKPRMVLPAMMSFYNREYQLYQGWPLTVWDLNMYITSAFISNAAFEILSADAVKYGTTTSLFSQIQWGAPPDQKTIYALALEYTGPQRARYKRADRWLAHWFIVQKGIAIELGQLGIGEDDFEIEMLKFSEMFYFIIYQLQAGNIAFGDAQALDQTKMYLKILLYYMNYYSDETYISGSALQYMRDKSLTGYQKDWKRIALLDNFAFVTEYFVHAMSDDNKNERQKWFYFFDRSFKYIVRIGDIMDIGGFHASIIEPIGRKLNDQTMNGINVNTPQADFYDYSWYTLARLWLRKNDKGKTIRGDIEKGDIIASDGGVSNKDIPQTHTERRLIVIGRMVWRAVMRKAGIPEDRPDPAANPVWERDTFYKYDNAADHPDRAPWTRVVSALRRPLNTRIGAAGISAQGLKDAALTMMYNICGKREFVTNVMRNAALDTLHAQDPPVLKGIVKADKKYGRKGQKLSISSSEAYNYKFYNPFGIIA